MRFGRLILASLTAFAAYSCAQSAPQPVSAHESLRFLQVVVPILVHAADSAVSTPAIQAPAHAVISIGALHTSPFAGSLCLVASVVAIDLGERRHLRTFLRC